MDPQLSMLIVAEAAEFRALVHDAFAKAGRPVALGPSNAHDESGRRYGLWNLASACHDSRVIRAAAMIAVVATLAIAQPSRSRARPASLRGDLPCRYAGYGIAICPG